MDNLTAAKFFYWFTSMGSGPDTVAPLYVASEVGNVANNLIVMVYNEALNPSVIPATTDFSVDDGAANAVTNIAISGATVRLTLTNAINNGDTVVVSYASGANKIQDYAGNAAIDLTDEGVTNNVAAGPSTSFTFEDDTIATDESGNTMITE